MKGCDSRGGVASVVVAEADLDVVPLDVQLLVAPVRDLLAAGVLRGVTQGIADTS